MQPPIIVAEGLDVFFFRSAAEAGRAVEGPDVHDGIYQAWDAAGRVLRLVPSGSRADYSAPVTVEPVAVGEPDVQGLTLLLRQFLAAIGEPVSDEATPLERLVAAGLAQAGYSQ